MGVHAVAVVMGSMSLCRRVRACSSLRVRRPVAIYSVSLVIWLFARRGTDDESGRVTRSFTFSISSID